MTATTRLKRAIRVLLGSEAGTPGAAPRTPAGIGTDAPTAPAAAAPATGPTPGEKRIIELLTDIKGELRGHRRNLESLRIATTAPVLHEVAGVLADIQLTAPETLRRLAEGRASMARFGDGELRLMTRSEFSLGFQTNSSGLQAALRRTLVPQPEDGELLIALPHLFRDAHWSGVWAELWSDVRALLDPATTYCNAHITRPNFFRTHGQAGVEMWREVWRDSSVAVITGTGARFDVIPELFDSATSVERIDAPATDAFDSLPSLIEAAEASDADIFLLALGPSATVLARELSARGRRALDVGHISASHRTVFAGAARPEHQTRG